MSSIRLTGFVGSPPLSALAAFGLLRYRIWVAAVRDAGLSWSLDLDWLVVLHKLIAPSPELRALLPRGTVAVYSYNANAITTAEARFVTQCSARVRC